MFLLDTHVISELRRRTPHGAVITWLRAVPDSALYLSAMTLGELQAGIEITRDRDATKAAEIEAWLDQVVEVYNVLPVDARVFRSWAVLMHRRSNDLMADAMIAATAQVHNLTVVTRNRRDFERLGVAVVNPFVDPAT